MTYSTAQQMLGEMKEFASFSSAAQRYIRRSLDVAVGRPACARLWARDALEAQSIAAQMRAYRAIEDVREALADDCDVEVARKLMGPLVGMSAFDLGEERLESFAAYAFLYERLIGAAVRPWLVSAFCAAAAMPTLHPLLRKALLRSIPEEAVTRAGWSCREAAFRPEWVEKVPVPVAI